MRADDCFELGNVVPHGLFGPLLLLARSLKAFLLSPRLCRHGLGLLRLQLCSLHLARLVFGLLGLVVALLGRALLFAAERRIELCQLFGRANKARVHKLKPRVLFYPAPAPRPVGERRCAFARGRKGARARPSRG